MVIIPLSLPDGTAVDCALDRAVYDQLQQEGFNIALLPPKHPNRPPYVRIHRMRDGQREWHLLHRWIMREQLQPGLVVHHRTYRTDPAAPCWNLAADLEVMSRADHSAAHRAARGLDVTITIDQQDLNQ